MFLLLKGIEYLVGGVVFGVMVGVVIGSLYLYLKYRKIKKFYGIKKVKSNFEVLNNILKIVILILLGIIVGLIMNLIDLILVL